MDLIIVGVRDDQFSTEFAAFAQQNGYSASILDSCEAAQLFSISIDSGQATVMPNLPMLIRTTSTPPVREDFDRSFQSGECFATLWAAAALNQALVLNRPTTHSFWGRISYSPELTKWRAGLREDTVEIFASQAPPPPTERFNHQWYLQDVGTHEIEAWNTLPDGKGPYRARWSKPNPTYEIVVVLNEKTWRCTTAAIDHLDLEQKSIKLLQRLDLSFASVVWNVSHDVQSATLVRVDPFPSFQQIQFVWSSLAPALLEVLVS